MKKILMIAVSILVISEFGWAEIIYFKDGRKIQGQIIEENKYSIKALVNGFPQIYYRYEIYRIEMDKKEVPGQESEKAGQSSQDKEQLIRRLLEVNGTRDSMNLRFNQIINKAPLEQQGELRKIIKTEEIIKRLIPLYAKYYTVEELKELITFYNSPTGRKHLETVPKIMEDSLHEIAKYFEEKAADPKLQNK